MSEPDPGGLFDGVLARGPVRDQVSDGAWLRAMLDVEAALARAEARAGIITSDEASAIELACESARFDAAAIGRDSAGGGNPVIPLVRALTAEVRGPAAGQVHRGATSQDVMDSAAMLVAHRALGLLLGDLRPASSAAAGLARAHRDTPMAGRTLLQQALPTTFGLKAAGWMAALDEAADRLQVVRRSRLAVQLGGAAGTLASLGDRGPAVLAALAEELGLCEPVLPWHTDRTRVAELASGLGEAAGAVAKPAVDVILMAQTEVAEVREASPGGSSTMPHKANPVAAVCASACARQAPGLVAILLAAMPQEHERAAGAWHSEWRPLTQLLETVGSAAAWLRECLEHLEVDPARMRANLNMTGGLLLAERVTTALTESLGRMKAHDLVEAAGHEATTAGRSFAAILAAVPEVNEHLSETQIEGLLEPSGYLGAAGAFVDRALHAHASGQSPGPP